MKLNPNTNKSVLCPYIISSDFFSISIGDKSLYFLSPNKYGTNEYANPLMIPGIINNNKNRQTNIYINNAVPKSLAKSSLYLNKSSNFGFLPFMKLIIK